MSAPLERARVRRRSEIADAELDGRIVVFNERTGRVRSFNATGTIVWQLLDGSARVGELGDSIAEELGIDPARARDDVRAFVAELLRLRFVERVA